MEPIDDCGSCWPMASNAALDSQDRPRQMADCANHVIAHPATQCAPWPPQVSRRRSACCIARANSALSLPKGCQKNACGRAASASTPVSVCCKCACSPDASLLPATAVDLLQHGCTDPHGSISGLSDALTRLLQRSATSNEPRLVEALVGLYKTQRCSTTLRRPSAAPARRLFEGRLLNASSTNC